MKSNSFRKKKNEEQQSLRPAKKGIRIDDSNIDVLKNICSKTGISWHELYYVNHNQYVTCLQVLDFSEESNYNQLASILDIPYVLVTLDCKPITFSEFEKQYDKVINKAYNAQSDSRKASDHRKSTKTQVEIESFYNYITNTKDGVVEASLRIFVFGRSLLELEDRANTIQNELKRIGGFQGYIQTNILEEDYQSLSCFSTPIKQLLSTSTVADFCLRSNISIVDEQALLLGYTRNGVYAPDYYSFKNYSYNLLALGGMGSGKSALIKKIHQNMYIQNNHVSVFFDIHGEYDEYCKALDIPIVSINENNTINLTQIHFVDNKDNDTIIRKNDIQTKISSIVDTFSNFTKISREQSKIVFELILNDMYQMYLGKDLQTIDNDEWFAMEDVLAEIIKRREDKEAPLLDESKDDYYNVELGLRKMIENYGYIFNSKTNMNFNLQRSLCFDISFLRNNTKDVQSSYVSLLLDYVSYGVYMNLIINHQYEKSCGFSLKELGRPYITHQVIIDESAKYIHNRAFLNKCLDLMKLMRKCFSGIVFVFHTTDDTQKDFQNHGDLLSEVFDLCTNKLIGKTDGTSLQSLSELVNGINQYDVKMIGNFRKGPNGERQFLVRDDQQRKLSFWSIVTPQEQAFYKGGM